MADAGSLPEIVNTAATPPEPPPTREVPLYMGPNVEAIIRQAQRQSLTQARFIGGDSEVATIIVRGRKFTDWESVWVQHRWAESSALFKFTAAERDPYPTLWQRLQFVPGDICTIYLGGVLALNNGIITDRQVAYDPGNHGVQLLGRSLTYYAAQSSTDHKDENFDGKTFEQVARTVLAPYPVGIKVVGTLNPRPYARLRGPKGATIWDFLETIARPRGIVLGSDHLGNILLIGDHSFAIDADLIEGQNIKKCQCLISIQNLYARYGGMAQSAGTDGHSGKQSNELYAEVQDKFPTAAYNLFTSPFPVWDEAELREEVDNEARWHKGTKIQATITTYGWFQPRAPNLWRAGQNVQTKSPMAILDRVLKAQTVTFTQDNTNGTETTLDLVAPWLLGDKKFQAGVDIDDDVPAPATSPPILQNAPTAPADSSKNGEFVSPDEQRLAQAISPWFGM